MKQILVLSLTAIVVCVRSYNSDYDNIDIESVVAHPGLLGELYGCFMDKAPCHGVAEAAKTILPEVFATACGKCTTAQKHILRRFLEELKWKMPMKYKEFKKRYDPEKKYFKNLAKAVTNF